MRAAVSSVPLLLLAAACESVPAERPPRPQDVVPQASAVRESAETMSLPDLVDLALAHGPEIAAARAMVDAADARRTQAGLWPNPRLSLVARDVPRDGWAVREGGSWVMLMQPIAVGGRIAAARRGADAEREAAVAGAALAARRIAADVRRMAADLAAAESVRSLREATATDAEALAAATRSAVERGARSETDALTLDIDAQRARAAVREAEIAVADARAALHGLLGGAAPALLHVVWPANDAGTEAYETLADHPAALEAAARSRAAELRVGEARREKIPDLEVTAGVGRMGEPDEGVVEAGIGFTLPLFDSGETKVRERMAELAVARADERRVVTTLAARRRASLAALAAASADVAAYRDRIVPAAERIAEQMRASFLNGGRSPSELVVVRRQLAEAREGAVQAERTHRRVGAELFETGRDLPPEAHR